MLNLALDGLRRLLKNGSFSYSASAQANSNEYYVMLDSVYAFWDTDTEPDPDGFISKEDGRTAYLQWCEYEDCYQVSMALYSRRLTTLRRKLGITEIRSRTGEESYLWLYRETFQGRMHT